MRISARAGPPAGGEKLASGPVDAARQLSPASGWIPHSPEVVNDQKCINKFGCGNPFSTGSLIHAPSHKPSSGFIWCSLKNLFPVTMHHNASHTSSAQIELPSPASHSMVVSFSCCSSRTPYGEPIPEPGFVLDQGSILAMAFKAIAQVINKFFD